MIILCFRMNQVDTTSLDFTAGGACAGLPSARGIRASSGRARIGSRCPHQQLRGSYWGGKTVCYIYIGERLGDCPPLRRVCL